MYFYKHIYIYIYTHTHTHTHTQTHRYTHVLPLINRSKKSVVKRKYYEACYSLFVQKTFSQRNTRCCRSQPHFHVREAHCQGALQTPS